MAARKIKKIKKIDNVKKQNFNTFSKEFNEEKFLSKSIKSIKELYNILNSLTSNSNEFLKIKIGNIWYLAKCDVRIHTNIFSNICYVESTYLVADRALTFFGIVRDSDFDNYSGGRTLRELFDIMNIKTASNQDLSKAKRKMKKLVEMHKTNRIIDVHSSALIYEESMFNYQLSEISFGNKDNAKICVIESELETEQPRSIYDEMENKNILPIVRAFSFDFKKYVYIDIDNFSEHVYDLSSKNRIILPNKFMNILSACFDTDNKNVVGDMFNKRHGGLVILASGPSGVGKTLSAEVFAECSSRPLYVMEMGELGTNLAHVEKSLKKIFLRASRWNAILLFDEADIFLAQRGSDLERSAIVGVFLRLLDNYNGAFFLTTNRNDIIDDAFKSRIMMKLDYPSLTSESREKIWSLLLQRAGFSVEGSLSEIAKEEINGRQIRNLVRLLKILYPKDKITPDEIKISFEYAAK